MYVNRIRLTNYGPFNWLDITLPFDNERPKPAVFVGPNGSGKSILLSHIVNGMLLAKQHTYPESPEVEIDKVYKIRSPQYIALGKDFYCASVDYTNGLWVGELQLNRQKQAFDKPPTEVDDADVEKLWGNMDETDTNCLDTMSLFEQKRLKNDFSENCFLYFPPDRYEDPAWLNETNLLSKASHLNLSHLEGHTERKIINYSSLQENQDWLFELAYDFSVFELQTSPVFVNFNRDGNLPQGKTLSVFQGYSGKSKTLFDLVLQVMRLLLEKDDDLRLSIGPRHDRRLSVMVGDQRLIPNIFQLSSGEISLLNLFLTILRDYDLTGTELQQAEDVKGIVVVDEIDLHLHTRLQYVVLPKLINMFPNVQFVLTTHSPLFILGLQGTLGKDGFGLYDLPSGQQLSAEDFGEFGKAYEAFVDTKRHTNEVRSAVQDAQKPLVFVEGPTDVNYMKRAAELLDFDSLLTTIEFREGGGANLKNVWKGLTTHHVHRKKVVVLHDPECSFDETRANVFRRSMCRFEDHPIQKGIENLFGRTTLEHVRENNPGCIDVIGEHPIQVRGIEQIVPETWSVNEDEKSRLCSWLCQNGTTDDFQHFQPTLEMLREIVEDS